MSELNRITPAHAGKKEAARPLRAALKGSPPHMRGKVRIGRGPQHHRGITPRVCGEKLNESYACGEAEGSPPRMRGKDHR